MARFSKCIQDRKLHIFTCSTNRNSLQTKGIRLTIIKIEITQYNFAEHFFVNILVSNYFNFTNACFTRDYLKNAYSPSFQYVIKFFA